MLSYTVLQPLMCGVSVLADDSLFATSPHMSLSLSLSLTLSHTNTNTHTHTHTLPHTQGTSRLCTDRYQSQRGPHSVCVLPPSLPPHLITGHQVERLTHHQQQVPGGVNALPAGGHPPPARQLRRPQGSSNDAGSSSSSNSDSSRRSSCCRHRCHCCSHCCHGSGSSQPAAAAKRPAASMVVDYCRQDRHPGQEGPCLERQQIPAIGGGALHTTGKSHSCFCVTSENNNCVTLPHNLVTSHM
jgi:hypothetical protein